MARVGAASGRWSLGQGAALVSIGIPLGLLASLFTSRLAAAIVVDVRPADWLVLAGVTVLLAVASFTAMLVPAGRAARIEPPTVGRVSVTPTRATRLAGKGRSHRVTPQGSSCRTLRE